MENARAFTVRLAGLLARERAALGDFLVALAEFDQRRLWVELGYASLFDLLHRELGLSKASASFRKKAAELVQRFPEVVEPLRDGRLCLTSVFELAKVLTPENRDEVLPRFFQLGKREAKAVAAALSPAAVPRREVVTAVRGASPSPALSTPRDSLALSAGSAAPGASASPATSSPSRRADAAESVSEDPVSLGVVRPAKPVHANLTCAPQEGASLAAAPTPPPAPAPMNVEPLTVELNRLHVTVSRRFLEKLEAARAALSHSNPGASADEILEAGLDLLIERHAKRRGLVEKPRRAPPPSKPDHVPAHVSRAVWQRDGGRCQWPAKGGICGSTHQVQIDHRLPRARGGPPTVDNLRLLCRVHNDLAARAVYGGAWMDRFTSRAGQPAQGAVRGTVRTPDA